MILIFAYREEFISSENNSKLKAFSVSLQLGNIFKNELFNLSKLASIHGLIILLSTFSTLGILAIVKGRIFRELWSLNPIAARNSSVL